MDIKRKTIYDDEEYLRQVSESVDLDNDNYQEWIKELEEYCTITKCFALAPVQIGIPKRMIYLKNTTLDNDKYENIDYNEHQIIINPKIIKMEGLTTYWEACLSCGNNLGKVYRPYRIVIEYYDEFKNKHQRTLEGFETTVFMHEYDHLDGILHIDKSIELITYPLDKREEYLEKALKQKRIDDPYNVINVDGKYNF